MGWVESSRVYAQPILDMTNFKWGRKEPTTNPPGTSDQASLGGSRVLGLLGL